MNTASSIGKTSVIVGMILGTIFTLAPRVGHAQELTFSFTVTLNGQTSDVRKFGLRADALQGFDEYDVPEPPAEPDAAFDSYLAMFNPPSSLPNRWRHDFRPTVNLLADRIELWQFDFQSDAIGSVATIAIETVGSVPVPYELYFFGPGVYYEPIEAPAVITFPVTANKLVFFWELRLADAVRVVPTTWGGFKNLYR